MAKVREDNCFTDRLPSEAFNDAPSVNRHLEHEPCLMRYSIETDYGDALLEVRIERIANIRRTSCSFVIDGVARSESFPPLRTFINIREDQIENKRARRGDFDRTPPECCLRGECGRSWMSHFLY